MEHLLFRPAAACSRAHLATSVSFVDLGLRLALGSDQGPSQLAAHLFLRWRRLGRRRAALQIFLGEVTRWRWNFSQGNLAAANHGTGGASHTVELFYTCALKINSLKRFSFKFNNL